MSSEKHYQRTFSRRKKQKPSDNNNNNEKGKRTEDVEEEVEVEGHQQNGDNKAEDLEALIIVPSSSTESSRGERDADLSRTKPPAENGGSKNAAKAKLPQQKNKKKDGDAAGKKQDKKKQPQQLNQKKRVAEVEAKEENGEKKRKTKVENGGSTGRGETKVMKEEEEQEEGAETAGEEVEGSAGCRFPMHRIDRIFRSETSDIRISNEAVFLINKAVEKFLEVFSEDSYACATQDHKNYISYKNLSTAVSKETRLNFLSDFVPEKVKAEKALAERNPAEKQKD